MARDTVLTKPPAKGPRRCWALGLPRQGALWLAFALVIVLSMLLGDLLYLLAGLPDDGALTGPLAGSPVAGGAHCRGPFSF